MWLSAENTGVVEALDPRRDDGTPDHDVLGALLFDNGQFSAELLADVHSHGNWIRWRAAS